MYDGVTWGRFRARAARWLLVGTLVPMSACAAPPSRPAAPADPAVSPGGFYSIEQADRGRAAFREACGSCHSVGEFRGRDFEWRWRRQTVWDLYRRVTGTMPENDPGSLPEQSYADVIAYILHINDYRAGGSDLLPVEKAMDEIPLGPEAERTGTEPGRDSR